MSRYWSTVVQGLTPYVPGEQPRLPGLVKLNTNENPYGPSPRALEAIRASADDGLRLYPDPTAQSLRTCIAGHYGLTPEQIFVGNGSDEVLAHAFLALLKHTDADGWPRPLLFPDITYSFYPVYCGLYDIRYEAVPLTADFEIRADDYLPERGHRAGGIILANPNAPTGRLLARGELERLLEANRDLVVVVDEAYIDFAGPYAEVGAIPLLARHPNLLVVHTLSKSRSLAGLRVGYAAGSAELIEGLTRVKDSFNSYPLDRLALAGAQASFEDVDHFSRTCAAVVASRERLVAGLSALGLVVVPSGANFVFARHPGMDGERLAQRLRERSIIVRHFRKPRRIDPYLRITVGTDAQCDRLVEALREILA